MQADKPVLLSWSCRDSPLEYFLPVLQEGNVATLKLCFWQAASPSPSPSGLEESVVPSLSNPLANPLQGAHLQHLHLQCPPKGFFWNHQVLHVMPHLRSLKVVDCTDPLCLGTVLCLLSDLQALHLQDCWSISVLGAVEGSGLASPLPSKLTSLWVEPPPEEWDDMCELLGAVKETLLSLTLNFHEVCTTSHLLTILDHLSPLLGGLQHVGLRHFSWPSNPSLQLPHLTSLRVFDSSLPLPQHLWACCCQEANLTTLDLEEVPQMTVRLSCGIRWFAIAQTPCVGCTWRGVRMCSCLDMNFSLDCASFINCVVYGLWSCLLVGATVAGMERRHFPSPWGPRCFLPSER